MRTTAIGVVLALVTGPLAGQMAWGPRPPGVEPPGRIGHAMAWDPVRREIVMYGGIGDLAALNDTWVWRGEWSERFPATAPPARGGTNAVFDAARGKIVLFGGQRQLSTPFLDDTWEWDGQNWTLRTPATKPPARSDYGLAYDPGRQRVVLYGGLNLATTLGTIWEWDGTNWQNKTPTSKPAARHSMAFCFDIGRGVCLMFGGSSGGTIVNETWTWNGGAWTQLSPPTSPPPRLDAYMVYDPTRDRVVLFGGFDAGDALSDTWEWDGSTWIPRSFGPAPGPRAVHRMEFDHGSGRVVLFGGIDGFITYRLPTDTWEYLNLTPARFEPLGPGCAGTAGIPVLAPLGQSKPWIGETFELDLRPIPAGAVATPFMLLGGSNEMWGTVPLPLDLGLIGMPGCLLQVSIDITVQLPNQGGWAALPLAIPYDFRLLGVPFFTQAFVLDPGANPGAVVSNAGLCLIGAK